ncbi:MAG: YlbF family regulator [Acholeplasmataceae bacterium]
MKKSDELIQSILKHPTILRYKTLESLITKNQQLKDQLSALKSVQKQMVNAKTYEKKQAYLAFKDAYDKQLEAIESTPLLSEYLALQSDINYMLQEIVGIIEDGINKDIEI